MTLYWTDKRGRKWPVCSCQKEWLTAYENELLRRGIVHNSIDLYQTIGNAPASAKFHSLGGCTDMMQRNHDALWVARNMGEAAWERDHDPNDGQPDFSTNHKHGTLKGCPHAYHLAKAQVPSLENGHNGTAGNGPDDGPRKGVQWPLRTWQEGIAWAKSQANPSPSPTPPSEVPVPTTSCTFNVLGINIYASQYTGGTFSPKRKAQLKETFAGPNGGNASYNLLSEVNRDYDHNTVLSLMAPQFRNPDVYTRASGNNHHYPDANKWEKTGSLILPLHSTTAQNRKVTLVTARHKATGIIVSFWASHFSSATHGATGAQADHSQAVEAKNLVAILKGKPLPDWDFSESVGYADMNWASDAAGHPRAIIGASGLRSLAHAGLVNAGYNSTHPLDSTPLKNGQRKDEIWYGPKVEVVSCSQIIGLYSATDHLAQKATLRVTA